MTASPRDIARIISEFGVALPLVEGGVPSPETVAENEMREAFDLQMHGVHVYDAGRMVTSARTMRTSDGAVFVEMLQGLPVVTKVEGDRLTTADGALWFRAPECGHVDCIALGMGVGGCARKEAGR